MHKTIAANTFYQLLTKSITSGVGLVLTIYIARMLGVSLYGDFTTITVFVSFFYLFVDFGANAVFLQHGGEPKHFAHLLFVRTIFALFLIMIVNVSAYILYVFGHTQGFTQTVRLGVLFFSITILSQGVFQSALAYFQKTLRYHYQLFASTIGSFITLFIILFLPISLYGALLAFVVGSIATSVFAIIVAKQPFFPFAFDKQYALRLIRDSLPLGIMLACNLLYFRSDIIILSILKPSVDVGIYGLAYKFFDFVIAVPLFLSNALYPHLLLAVSNKEQFNNLVKRYVPVFLGISFLFLITFWIIAPLFSFIRSSFADSVLPFRILLISLPVFFMTSLLQWLLIAKRKQKLLLYIYLPGLVINVFLNVVFIPYYSYIASAIITGISELFVLISLIVFVKRFAKE